MRTRNLLLGISGLIAAIFFSANTSAQEACNWYGRDIVPLCENKAEGWGRENGQRCISRNACLNDQPNDRGGVIGSGSGGDGSGGG